MNTKLKLEPLPITNDDDKKSYEEHDIQLWAKVVEWFFNFVAQPLNFADIQNIAAQRIQTQKKYGAFNVAKIVPKGVGPLREDVFDDVVNKKIYVNEASNIFKMTVATIDNFATQDQVQKKVNQKTILMTIGCDVAPHYYIKQSQVNLIFDVFEGAIIIKSAYLLSRDSNVKPIDQIYVDWVVNDLFKFKDDFKIVPSNPHTPVYLVNCWVELFNPLQMTDEEQMQFLDDDSEYGPMEVTVDDDNDDFLNDPYLSYFCQHPEEAQQQKQNEPSQQLDKFYEFLATLHFLGNEQQQSNKFEEFMTSLQLVANYQNQKIMSESQQTFDPSSNKNATTNPILPIKTIHKK